ncbi:MAG: ATP-binding cassette domain-containing protein [Acidobacteriota bacterium]|jgi:ATPase subunit of ABC transporter with duplicated ATPase domains|nr:ATP-binding cassette domain-containing protein [Acidobacteriota bacterium]
MFLSLKNVDFAYENSQEAVFENLTFTIGQGWTGVVGANGSGKSTLLRLALGELSPAKGQIHQPCPGLYCEQRTDSAPDGLRDLLDDWRPEAQRLNQTLGLRPDWACRWETLSHGERKRAQIAVMLHQNPGLLAVDEPTNHLDHKAAKQVWQALKLFQGIGLLVSHDRELLDDLCGQCLFLTPPGTVLRPGGYSEGATEAKKEALAAQRRLTKASREVARLQKEFYIRREQTNKAERQRSKRGIPRKDRDAKAKVDAARVADSGSGQRMRQVEGRLELAIEKRSEIKKKREFSLGISIGGAQAQKRILVSLEEQRIPLGDDNYLWIPALFIQSDDRIGIQGPNGAGKSTLVRRIADGFGRTSHKIAYIPQEIDAARSRRVLEDFLKLPNDRLGRAMTLVRRLGSDPARLLQSAEPSPGELRKLLIAACIQDDPNILILDEPTNHMDLPSIECLENALEDCPMALLMVSHDRRFLGKLAKQIWTIQKGREHAWELYSRMA